MKKFHEILREKRKELNMTQQEFANKLNVSNKTVSKWETGRYYPDITIIASIAKVLNTTVEELMGADDLSKININENDIKNDEQIIKHKRNVVISISLLSSVILLFINKIEFTIFNDNNSGLANISYDFDLYKIVTIIISIIVSVCILLSTTILVISSISYKNYKAKLDK